MRTNLIAIIVALVLTLQYNNIQGQEYVPFPDSNAIWSEVFISYQPDEVETYQYGILGDTLINSQLYHTVYKLNDTVYPLVPGQYCGAIREDSSKRIFAIGCDCTYPGSGGDEVLLYDFSKSIGDTVFVGIDGIGPEGYLIISNIDSMLIENKYRKTFRFITLQDYFWIEGIGSTRGLFSPLTYQTSGFQKWKLICFNQDNTVKYLNPEFNSCFPILTKVNTNKKEGQNLQVYPNPVTGKSMIEFDSAEHTFQYFEIYNMVGQKVEERNVEGEKRIFINRNNYKAGFYVFRISGQNVKSKTGRLIIE